MFNIYFTLKFNIENLENELPEWLSSFYTILKIDIQDLKVRKAERRIRKGLKQEGTVGQRKL